MTPPPKRNPADLLAKVFNEEFPLNNNTLSLIVGGAGSGKSYYAYNVLVPIYLQSFGIQHLILCSKTAKIDQTLQDSLKGVLDKYPYMTKHYAPIGEITKKCQNIRARAIKAELLERISKDYDTFEKLADFTTRKLKKEAEAMVSFPRIREELKQVRKDLTFLMDINNYLVEVMTENEEFETTFTDGGKDRGLWKDPENYDINYNLNDEHGLGINFKPFKNPAVCPRLRVVRKEDDDDETVRQKIKAELMTFILSKIVDVRRKSLFFGAPHQPILVVIDDNVGERALYNSNSDLCQFALLRRHLHASLFILSQTITGISTNLRRNANSIHLLPSLSLLDLKLIQGRLPVSISFNDLIERYNANTARDDRNQQMTSIFGVHPYTGVIDGAPECILRFYPE